MRTNWSTEEIGTVHLRFSKMDKSRKRLRKSLDHVIFWLLAATAVMANAVAAFALVPIIVFVRNASIFVILFIVGFVFGLMFDRLLKQYQAGLRHIIALVLIITGTLAIFGLEVKHFVLPYDSMLIASTYCIAFLIPFIVRGTRGSR